MISPHTTQYIEWVLEFKYPLLFPIAVFEGPIITIVAGFLVSLSKMNFLAAYVVIIIADLTGDVLYYVFGRSGGRRLVEKWGIRFGITPEHLERIENHFKHHPGKTLLMGKVAHGLGGFFLTAAGLAKMPFGRFLFYNFVPTVFKTLLLLSIGYYFGNAYVQINKYLNTTATVFLLLGLLLAAIYFIIPIIMRSKFRIKM
jgi:membrane protein DedA with SNARE-associated domain